MKLAQFLEGHDVAIYAGSSVTISQPNEVPPPSIALF